MKIYFAGSIRGGRDDKEIYLQIIKMLATYGEVLTEHIGDNNLEEVGEKDLTEEYIYNRDINWLKESDIVVAEVTNPSLGVGYELAKSQEWKKKVLCLYRKQEGKKLSAMIKGANYFDIREYSDVCEVEEILREYFSS